MYILLNDKLKRRATRLQMFVEAACIIVGVLALFYYWFGIADRYALFLYGHVAIQPEPAQPFDAITSSRYWMAGFVAAGAVMVIYTAANWLAAQVARWRGRRFVPSSWWRVWLLCVVPLGIGIPLITMTLNAPTLPPLLAAACLGTTLTGLAVALMPGAWAAKRPRELVWLGADAVGLMPPLLLLHVVEFADRSATVSRATFWIFAMVMIGLGIGWLGLMSLLRRWRRKEIPTAGALWFAALGLSYLLLPLVHYLVFTPAEYRYISNSENFFASNPLLQLAALGLAGLIAWGVTGARRRWRGT